MRTSSVRVLSLALSSLAAFVSIAFAGPITGRVLDQSGRGVPRAVVRVLAPTGQTLGVVFTQIDGSFSVDTSATECRVEAALSGFAAADAPCSTNAVQLILPVAPLQETIVVSATRSEMPSGQLASAATVFTADDLERRQVPHVADLLAMSAGVMVSRSGGYGNLTSVFVRGGESNYNKVLLDGIPLNEPGGVFNFGSLTVDNLERIEIVRGAHSALFGSDAMASVIHLVSRRGTAGSGLRGRVTVEGGTYATLRSRADISGASGRLDYSLGGAVFRTDNREPNNAFNSQTVSSQVGVQLSARSALRGVFRGEFGKAGAPGQTAFGRPDADAFFKRNDAVGGITFAQELGALRQRGTYALSATNQASTNLRLDPPYTPRFGDSLAPFEFFDFAYDSRTNLRRHYATYQVDWTPLSSPSGAGAHQMTAAVDWEGERGTLRDALAEMQTRIRRDNFGWTFQHQASWTRVFAAAGVRIERNESFGTSAVPRGSIAVVLRKGDTAFGETKLKASAGRGVKEPTALQTFSLSPSFLGNPDLQPEEARSVDVGVEQRFARGRTRLEAIWFDNRFHNIISTRTTSFNPFRSQYFNIGETTARGIELTLAAAPFAGLQMGGGYTLLDSKIVKSTAPFNPVFAEGAWLFRRPRHSGFVEISGASHALTFSLSGLFTGRRIDSDFSALEPPIALNEARATWDARLSYALTRTLAATFAVDNLTDRRYMEPLGYPALGRAMRVGVRAGF